MKDVTKAPASGKGSKRTAQQTTAQQTTVQQADVQQAALLVADKTTGTSKRAPRRNAAVRQANAAEGLRGEGDTIGIDIGDRVSQFCRLDASGEIAEQGKLHTSAASLEKHFAKLPSAVIALEAGTQSGWIARLLRRFGHKAIGDRLRVSGFSVQGHPGGFRDRRVNLETPGMRRTRPFLLTPDP
jgi:hypothetical protein